MSMITRAELQEELVRWEEGIDARLEELRAEVHALKHSLEAVRRHLEVFEGDPGAGANGSA